MQENISEGLFSNSQVQLGEIVNYSICKLTTTVLAHVPVAKNSTKWKKQEMTEKPGKIL
jgi:hypothetical protein